MGFHVHTIGLLEEPLDAGLDPESRLETALEHVGAGEGMRALAGGLGVLREAGASQISAVGLGLGGVMVLLAAGALPGFTAVVAFGPRLVHPVLTRRHPMQPIDLLAGARVPVQVHLAEDSVLTPAAQQDRLESSMSRSEQPHQCFRYSGVRDGFEQVPDSPSGASAWYRARDFLGFHARLEHS